MTLISYLTTIRFKAGALSDVGSDMRELGIRTPLIVADAGIARAGLVERLTDALPAGQHIPVFTDTPTNPTEGAVLAALNLFQSDRTARHEMMMAALEGGLTFQKGLGAVHALSHPSEV